MHQDGMGSISGRSGRDRNEQREFRHVVKHGEDGCTTCSCGSRGIENLVVDLYEPESVFRMYRVTYWSV